MPCPVYKRLEDKIMTTNFPPINEIFDDLDKFRDYCRFEGKVFDERDLYNEKSRVWRSYQKYLTWKANKKQSSPRKRR